MSFRQSNRNIGDKIMKIDIITLHAVQNYGSVLQAFATQEKLKQYGCEVTIINYTRDVVKYENLRKIWGQGNPVRSLVIMPTIKRWKHVFKDFCEKNLNLSEERYSDEKDFEGYPLKADAYCTGSDQVWNSKWNNGIIPPLYLSFVPKNCYKFSYAASFGQTYLEQNEINITQKYIDEYKYISVREKSGIDILEKQYHYEKSVQIVDPTLALSSDFWRQYSTPRIIKGEYILIYNLNRSKEFDNYAVQLSKKTGIKLVRLCTRYDQFYRPGKSMFVPEIFEFVSLIDNAKYVLTDSFHATAFSMNMNTEPICVYPKEFGGRIESFLQITESLQRRVVDYDDFDVVNRPVDFKKVNQILENERKKIDAYLRTIISEIAHQKEQLDR